MKKVDENVFDSLRGCERQPFNGCARLALGRACNGELGANPGARHAKATGTERSISFAAGSHASEAIN